MDGRARGQDCRDLLRWTVGKTLRSRLFDINVLPPIRGNPGEDGLQFAQRD